MRSGKTTLYNKICGLQNKTKSGGQSVTKSVYLSESCFGNGFKIMDTPGLGVTKNKYKNAILQLSSFEYKPLNQIILTVRRDRIDIMITFIKMCIAPLEQHKDLITVVITHWDQCEDESEIYLIEEVLIKQFGISQFFFVQEDTKGNYICEQLDKRMRQIAVQVKITDDNFCKNFELSEDNDYLEQIVTQISQSFSMMGKAVQNKIIQLEKDKEKQEDMDEILHSLNLWIKDQAMFLLDSFYKEYGHIMNDQYIQTNNAQESYIFQFQLKNSIFKKLDDTTKFILDRMMLKDNHPLNQIKECCYCGLIWLKVQGCNGETSCGIFPPKDQLIHEQTKNLRVQIKFIDNQIELEFHEDQLLRKQNEEMGQKLVQYQKQYIQYQKEIENSTNQSFLARILFRSGSQNDDKLKKLNNLIKEGNKQIAFNQKLIEELVLQLKVNIDQYEKNQQNLKGCGKPIIWSELKTPTNLLKQLVDDQILDFLIENEQTQKFSNQKKQDLDQSINEIIFQ
ncbi:hypothetical protein pb186bvf_009983 [Paramecium bursaria]